MEVSVYFVQFLEVARAQDPQFLSTAENLIKGYYIASRHVRATGAKTTVIPQSAIKTMWIANELTNMYRIKTCALDHLSLVDVE